MGESMSSENFAKLSKVVYKLIERILHGDIPWERTGEEKVFQ